MEAAEAESLVVQVTRVEAGPRFEPDQRRWEKKERQETGLEREHEKKKRTDVETGNVNFHHGLKHCQRMEAVAAGFRRVSGA
jgi:hypothetical protein